MFGIGSEYLMTSVEENLCTRFGTDFGKDRRKMAAIVILRVL